MKNNFLLNTKTAKQLYSAVKELPIIDYHNHLSVAEICQDKRYYDIYELWLAPDPYKHRAMRMCGVEEKYITGDGTPEEKFAKWWETLPRLIGNPLYIWAQMELQQVFGICDIPNGLDASEVYSRCNRYLRDNVVSARSLLAKFNAEFVCPCASLVDETQVFENSVFFAPSLRGDDIVNITADFVKKLENTSKICIRDLPALKNAICARLDKFEQAGCKFSDHALDNGFVFVLDDGNNELRFARVLEGVADSDDKMHLASYLLTYLGGEYAKRGFVMQLHIGAQRYTSTRLRNLTGPTGGYASIGNSVDVITLTNYLDSVERAAGYLPKTVLFTLNPADNGLISVLSGSYSRDGVAGLVTQGPAWWWCDHKQGIAAMLYNTMSYSLLSNFVGMTTDSRSFLSFVRHDYFRRILCDFLGDKYEQGELGCTFDGLKHLAENVCYYNAKNISGGKKYEF